MNKKQIDKKIEVMIKELLEIKDEIKFDLTFFQLGGQSIKASKFQILLMKEFQVRISIRDLYKNTIRELEELIYEKKLN